MTQSEPSAAEPREAAQAPADVAAAGAQAEPPSANEEKPAPPARTDPPTAPTKTEAPAPDAPITNKVLRAAASSPDELLEIMREEEKVRRTRASRQAPAAQSSAPPTGAATRPGPPPGGRSPQVSKASSIFASALHASGSGPIPQESAEARPARPRPANRPPAPRPPARPPAPPAELPEPVTSTTESGVGRISGYGPVGGGGATRIVLPRAPVLPLVITLGACTLVVALTAVHVGRELSGALATRARGEVPSPTARPLLPEPREREEAPQLASIGGGRVIQITPDGDLIVLRGDPTSGELEVERAYRLAHDPDRHQGDPGRRRWHGYYLDDLDLARFEQIQAAERAFERVVSAAVRLEAKLEDIEQAGYELARLGGAAQLFPALEASGAEPVEALRKHGAGVGLGRAGYLSATPALLELLEQHQASPELAPRLTGILSNLSGLELDPSEVGETLERVEQWWSSRAPVDRFQRVP